jgi:hypothetical protein
MTGLIGELDFAQRLSYLYASLTVRSNNSLRICLSSQLARGIFATNFLADLRRVPRTMQPAKKNPGSWFSPKTSLIACSWRPEYAKKMASRSSKVHSSDTTCELSPRLTLSSDTLIVWTEPSNSTDMALSFQEAEGCAVIWLAPG